jgi:6-pyruvoyltetrahydropterin/6-carboxytetrahydropterin synthase
MIITRTYEWDMAHRLPFHDGKCRRLHGHRYKAELTVAGPIITSGSEYGMVMDFDRIKKAVDNTFSYWDHRCMLWACDTLRIENEEAEGVFRVPYMPTAENIAHEIFLMLRHEGLPMLSVRVYETPNGWAVADGK